MARISCLIDDRALHVLRRLSAIQNKTVEEVAAQIIESEAIRHLPGGQANMHFGDRLPLDLGSVGIGMYERPNDQMMVRD